MSAVAVRPDRVGDAASARRRELAATRRRLAAGYHADLRAALGLARLSCSAGLSADLEDLGRRASEGVQCSGRAERGRLPSWLAGELDEVRRRSDERFAATAGPAVRRVAARICPGAPPMPLPGPPLVEGSAPEPAGLRPVRTGASGVIPGIRAAERGVDPRLLAGAAGLPVLGAGGLGWAAALTAFGVLLLLGALAHTRGRTAARARLRAEMSRSVAVAGAGAERALQRRLIELERDAGAALDRAVTERRARVDAELAEVPGAVR